MSSLQIEKNKPLKSFSSWLVGGNAEFFAEPQSLNDIREAFLAASRENRPLTILGGGTNVLINDKGIAGLVVSLRKLSKIEEISQKDNHLEFWSWSGTPKSEILKLLLKHKSPAACFLAGLPGQVGGGVVMNAGVSEKLRPREFCEIVSAIEVVRPQGHIEVIDGQKLQWSYRHCDGWKPGIISRIKISVEINSSTDVLSEVKNLNQMRLKKQPLEFPSCGSVFRNPLPRHAGQLIEEAGLKGHRMGGAQISEKHANFIINTGNATAADIRALIELAQTTIKKKFGIDLITEVVFL